jgi:hypothetical protein
MDNEPGREPSARPLDPAADERHGRSGLADQASRWLRNRRRRHYVSSVQRRLHEYDPSR